MIGMVAMAHVDPEGVGARLGQRLDHLRPNRSPGPSVARMRTLRPRGAAKTAGMEARTMASGIAADRPVATGLRGP